MEVGEHHLVFFYQGIFRFDRFLNFDDHFGDGVDILDCGEDGCSGVQILFIGETASFTGGFLDIYFVAVAYEFFSPEGVTPTRFSLFLISLGTPIIIVIIVKD